MSGRQDGLLGLTLRNPQSLCDSVKIFCCKDLVDMELFEKLLSSGKGDWHNSVDAPENISDGLPHWFMAAGICHPQETFCLVRPEKSNNQKKDLILLRKGGLFDLKPEAKNTFLT